MQREDLRDRMLRLFGNTDLRDSTEAMNDAAARLSRLFTAQAGLNVAFGIVIGVGLWIIGVPNAVLWGMLACVMRIVPYIGAPIAAVFPIALAAAVDTGWAMVGASASLFIVMLTPQSAVQYSINSTIPSAAEDSRYCPDF